MHVRLRACKSVSLREACRHFKPARCQGKRGGGGGGCRAYLFFSFGGTRGINPILVLASSLEAREKLSDIRATSLSLLSLLFLVPPSHHPHPQPLVILFALTKTSLSLRNVNSRRLTRRETLYVGRREDSRLLLLSSSCLSRSGRSWATLPFPLKFVCRSLLLKRQLDVPPAPGLFYSYSRCDGV